MKNRLPLVLLGARQVGKTWILKQFAKTNYTQYHYFNFEENPNLSLCFESLDVDKIIEQLSIQVSFAISCEDLIIFDEIQLAPRALTSLKYFAEDQRYQIMSAGSHLGLGLGQESFPVGKVTFHTLYPMTFSEFLAANEVHYSQEKSSLQTHQLNEQFRNYIFVGGMPAAVKIWNNISEPLVYRIKATRDIQEAILLGYKNYFAKYCETKDALYIGKLYEEIATQLFKYHDESVKRFKFKGALKGKKEFGQFETYFHWLEKSGLIYKTFVINHEPHYPLMTNKTESMFKAFYHDLGLLNATLGITYQVLMEQKFGYYKGFILENFAATQLILYSHKAQLYSWSENESEIEFLWANNDGSIIPIEIKSSKKSRSKSLDSYIKRYSPKVGMKFCADISQIQQIDEGDKQCKSLKVLFEIEMWAYNCSLDQ